ncbi:MAG TPA: hypothetical protein PK765_05410 [bacterium]|nr:hypothetical protein [bacterium]
MTMHASRAQFHDTHPHIHAIDPVASTALQRIQEAVFYAADRIGGDHRDVCVQLNKVVAEKRNTLGINSDPEAPVDSKKLLELANVVDAAETALRSTDTKNRTVE